MLKGYQRRLIMIRTKESRLFESAFFILRQAPRGALEQTDDMISEAKRIIGESGRGNKKRSFGSKHILMAAGIGFLTGAGVILTLLALLM